MTITAFDTNELIRLYHEVTSIYDNYTAARLWLVTSNDELNGRKPCECIITPQGRERVQKAVEALREVFNA